MPFVVLIVTLEFVSPVLLSVPVMFGVNRMLAAFGLVMSCAMVRPLKDCVVVASVTLLSVVVAHPEPSPVMPEDEPQPEAVAETVPSALTCKHRVPVPPALDTIRFVVLPVTIVRAVVDAYGNCDAATVDDAVKTPAVWIVLVVAADVVEKKFANVKAGVGSEVM